MAAVQDEIEIEIAEVLYGMMRMPLAATSKQEPSGGEEGAKAAVDVKSRASSPISNSQGVLQSSTITLGANSSSSNVNAIGKSSSLHSQPFVLFFFCLF